MYNHSRFNPYAINRKSLPETICQTYLLLSGCIALYLFSANTVGMYAISMPYLSFIGIISSFGLLFATMATKMQLPLLAFAFSVGVSHHPMFDYLNFMEPSIIHHALSTTLMVFVGLTYLAFTTSEYPTFLLYGFLYSSLSTIVWMGLLNIFFRNSFLDLLLTYFSVMVFTLFVVYDTHDMIKNNNKTPVDHALQLFLDFVNLFVDLVKLLRHFKKRNN